MSRTTRNSREESWRASVAFSRTTTGSTSIDSAIGKRRLETVDKLRVDVAVRPLYDYLATGGSFVPLDNHCEDYLSIFSRDVLRRIAEGDETWEPMVPTGVAELIKKRGFFGCVRSPM